MDSKAQTRSAGCAAYMAPERINPPNPNKPDYDIRADVWSLGITLVELATGQFPYKDCQTEFEVLTKVIQDDPPCLPQNKGFTIEFRQFVHDCLLKNHKDRPKYKKLLEHPFIIKYRDMDVDVGHWYYRVANHSGNPNKAVVEAVGVTAGLPPSRKTSLEQRHEAQQPAFKPQPSPRMVKSWRMQTASTTAASPYTSAADDHTRSTAAASGVAADNSVSYSRLNFYTPSSPTTNSSAAQADEPLPSAAYTRSAGSDRHQYQQHSSRLTDYPDYSTSHQLADQMARLGDSKSPRDQKGSRSSDQSSPREHLSKYSDSPRELMSRLNESTSPREHATSSRLESSYTARNAETSGMSPRYEKSSRLQDLSPKSTYEPGGVGGSGSSLRYYEASRTAGGSTSTTSYLDSSRIHLNGTGLNRSASNFMSSYQSGASTYHRATQPPASSTYARSHHEDYPSSLKSPPASKSYDRYGSYSETNSPRDYSGHNPGGSQRKYSFEGLEGGTGAISSSRPEYSSYTPKGTRRYEALSSPDQQSPRRTAVADSSSRKGEAGHEQHQWLDSSSSYRPSYADRESSSLLASYRTSREAASGGSSRKYTSLSSPTEVTATSRGRDPVRETPGSASGRSNFLSSLKFPAWSPLNIRKFRTSSSTDRASGFERSVRNQPAYRSLNEKDKQLYSSSGKSDKL